MASRAIEDLDPETRKRALRFLAAAEAAGIDLLVTCTRRTFPEQGILYAIGRTVDGAPCKCGGQVRTPGTCAKHPRGLTVTNAEPGESWHNWDGALDVVPMRNGKPVWGTRGVDGELWAEVGALGEAAGLEWAGRWKRFPEFPHFQFTGGRDWRDLLREHPAGLHT